MARARGWALPPRLGAFSLLLRPPSSAGYRIVWCCRAGRGPPVVWVSGPWLGIAPADRCLLANVRGPRRPGAATTARRAAARGGGRVKKKLEP